MQSGGERGTWIPFPPHAADPDLRKLHLRFILDSCCVQHRLRATLRFDRGNLPRVAIENDSWSH